MRPLLAGFAALALAGCGGGEPSSGASGASAGEARLLALAGGLQSLFASGGGEIGATPETPAGFTQEAIAAEPGAYRVVQVNALGLSEVGQVVQENGDEITLALQSGPTAAFDGGVLVATRGFGDDLMALSSEQVLPALRAGSGRFARRMEVLDDLDQIGIQDFDCTVSAAGEETVNLGVREATLRRLDENCRGEALVFDNIYWLDDAGEVVASRQFVSPTVAYLRANRL